MDQVGAFFVPMAPSSTWVPVYHALLFYDAGSSEVDDDYVDSANATADLPSWQTLSDNVVSLSFRYYRDFDYDGCIDEDPPWSGAASNPWPARPDLDNDGTVSEDPPLNPPTEDQDPGYGDFRRQPLSYWSGFEFPDPIDPSAGEAGWQQYSYWMPALVEIRILIRDSRRRVYRAFSRLVHIPSYDEIRGPDNVAEIED